MDKKPRLRAHTTLAGFAIALTLALLSATGNPGTANAAATPAPVSTPALGADLGATSGLSFASDAGTCGQHMTTQSQVAACDPAIAAHKLVLVWNFNANGCEKAPCRPPDGFNILRSPNGSGAAEVFATEHVDPAQTAVILDVKGDENIGACFYVLPYRGTDDFGRRSGAACISEVMHLSPTREGSAHSYSYDNGTSCKSPSSNPIGYSYVYHAAGGPLVSGYVTRSGGTSVLGVLANPIDALAQAVAVGEAVATSGQNTCNHYRDVFQGLVYFDLTPLAGKHISKATLDFTVASGGWNAGSPGGGDGTEHSTAVNCVATVGFPTNVNVGSDPSFPARILFDPAVTLHGGVGHISADVTGMVHAWLNPGGVNRGIVLSPSYLDPTKIVAHGSAVAYNADCVSKLEDAKLTVDLH